MKVARAGANGSASGPIAKNKAAAVLSPTPQGAVRPQAPTSAAAPAALQEEVISPVVVPESAVEAQQDEVSLHNLSSPWNYALKGPVHSIPVSRHLPPPNCPLE